MNAGFKRGFTLIELVLVVAILAIVSVVAIGKFSDFRKNAARKTNVANLKNITRTINTKLAMLDGEVQRGLFAYCESLIDCAEGGGAPRGTEGDYLYKSSWYDGAGGSVPGIYCGIKRTEAVVNASGVGTGQVAAIADAHESNLGLEKFASSLMMYYPTAKEVGSLRDAGISVLSYHNYSNQQSSRVCKWTGSEWELNYGLHATGGGPGQRADLSACYPVVLTNGMAIAVLNPAKCASIYRDLGLDYATTNRVEGLNAEDPKTYFTKGICKRLVAVGMGRDSEINTKLFENMPRCPTLDQKHYRNYILLFSMDNGTGNSGTAVTFVGVIDPEGNTAKSAQYNADWAS